jgi:hypothetical protein
MRIKLFIFVLFIAWTSCSPTQKITDCGVVCVKFELYNKDTIPFLPAFKSNYRIWYKDSSAIEEIQATNITTDTTGKTTTEVVVLHYTFIDLRSRSFFEYKNFADTAIVLKKYSQPDSTPLLGGWNFYFDRNIDYTGLPQPLDDTVISQVKYKRVKFNRGSGEKSYTSIGYFRCDKKGTMFRRDKSYSEKLGCPMVRTDNYPMGWKQPSSSMEVVFLSDTLTKEELKVFDAWERSAKLNPLK